MATDQPLQPMEPIQHRTTRLSRWLRERRIRISLWIAVIEGIVAALSSQSTRYLLFALSIVVLAVYIFLGRRAASDTLRQLTWIGGASQSLVVLVTLLALFIFHVLALVLAAVFAVVALVFLFTDRG